ncbi:hypothetical protein J2X69_004519 [Algoriphagus sp. 4150]|uniref:hypothetical protein n=1 Tax=Algoriphagus sp. 4150 TaxID=2817756 RepID=UPI00285B88A6|nr:hypothetical protein [Algoriphagus sp. 4150]MDR7132152.1 hypothetical protein [Algoriphagus sp. 4150]
MKKLICILFLLGGLTYLSSANAIAQEISTTAVDAKTKEKVEKSIASLEKHKVQHEKAIKKRQDLRTNFEKKNSAGKLSPNDVQKITKSMEKQSKSIGKLEKKMKKLEDYINANS